MILLATAGPKSSPKPKETSSQQGGGKEVMGVTLVLPQAGPWHLVKSSQVKSNDEDNHQLTVVQLT